MKIQIKPIDQQTLQGYLAVPDLTQMAEPHAVKLLYQNIEESIRRAHPESEVMVYRASPIVTVKDCYDDLLFPAENISRSSTYTHYLDNEHILRTHTTAHIPGLLKDLADRDDWNDAVILLPGLVYRRDVTDRKHLGILHQLDVWRVHRNGSGEPISKDDLVTVVKSIAETAALGWTLRIVDNPHPYTKEGIEVNVTQGERDIEILECGLISDQILSNAGLDPHIYSGWALGMGLDRLVMTLKDIPDIRYLRSTNPDIARQMVDLEIYHEVSHQPSIKRDMSYCVPDEYVEEDVNEDIRQALAEKVNILESVEVLNEALWASLPEVVRQRLGCSPGQKNVLVRVTLRHLERSLTNQEANDLYELVYAKVNRGSGGYL